jgi:hypothetical protein
MALDRTWYNSLVDDDGSGLTGSVWDKADVDALMDAVDAELARIDAGTVVAAGPMTPILQSYGGGTPIYALQSGYYIKQQRLMVVMGRVALSSKGSFAAGQLVLGGFPYAASASLHQAGLTIGYFTGVATSVSGLGTAMNPSLGSANLYYVPGAGSGNVAALTVADVTVNFDFMFGGVYKTDS